MISKVRVRVFAWVMAMLFAATAFGQIRFKIEHYSAEDGLSHDGVMSILKDHEGFMWFGTWDGINRFDGHSFITYKARPGDNSNLKNNRIESIVEDKAGYLWVLAYDKQVYRFDKKSETFLAAAELSADANIRNATFEKMVPTEAGALWLTTKENGVYCLSDVKSAKPGLIKYSEGSKAGFKLPSNKLVFLHEDKQHNFWIGTQKGLVCFVKDGQGNYKAAGLAAQFMLRYNFTAMAEDSQTIWFSTTQGVLVTYQKATKKFAATRVSSNSINSVFVSGKRNVLYLSTSASELITVNIADMKVSAAKMANADPFFSIYEDREGRLWIEPALHGIVKYDPVNGKFKYYFQKNDASAYNPAERYSVFEDNNNIIWTTLKGGGFGYYNAEKDNVDYFFDEPGTDNRQFSNIITCKYFDPAGVLWLSSNDRGVSKIVFQRNDFYPKMLVEHSANKSDNEIRGIYSDKQGRTWLGSKSDKLYVYDRSGKLISNIFINEPKDGIGMVYTITQDRTGVIWLGTKASGLFKAEPIDKAGSKYKLTQYQADDKDINSLSNNSIYSVIEDKKGRIWVGTFGKSINLLVNNNGKTQFRNVNNAFKNFPKGGFMRVRHLQEDEQGNIWIATSDGLVLLNPNTSNADNYQFKVFRKQQGDKSSLGNNNVQFVFKDAKHVMWVLTSGGGLNKAIGNDPFRSLKFQVLTKEDGLPNDYLLSCAQDNKGNLWLATENGLSKFDPERKIFKNYDSYDGLPKAGFSEASSIKLANGKIMFGCISGYISFDPDKIIDHKVSENMALTNLQINNQDIMPGSSSPLKLNINNTADITLKHNQNIISIDYNVLDFRSSSKQMYSYRLKGFDTIWHNNKNQHRATYTNLPYGNYVFEVKSLSNNLYTNQPSKKLAITILPPPWRTWWAYLLYVIASVVIIETVRRTALTMFKLRHRITFEQKLADLKLSFFTNVSHELRTPLTLILNPIDEISRKENLSEQGTEYINIVRKNANRMVRFINQLLDLRKMQSGKAQLKVSHTEVLAFVGRIGGYFTEVAREKNIKLKITSNVGELYAWFDAEKIDIVVYNILANAFKFTPNGKSITVDVHKNEAGNDFTINVIDQGVGVPVAQLNDIFELYYEGSKIEGNHLKGTGIGLAFSKELILLHQGKIHAENCKDSGLRVVIELKLGKEHLKGEQVTFVDAEDESEYTQPEMAETVAMEISDTGIDLPLILLVEDNNDLRKFLKVQLSEFYRVEEAENGEVGLKKANQLLPDLILSDVMMPKMDGIEMLDQIKNSETTSHIPVVLLTAKFSVESQIEGLKYGADYYLTKPFENDLLLTLISNLLKQRKHIFDSLLAGKKTVELGPTEVVITSKDEVFLKKIIQIVEDGMYDPEFNIDTVAETMGMGRQTFYRKFKSLTNMVPVEFVRDMRLKRAKQLMDAGESNVSEVGYTVGFSSAGYFGKCFKDKFNLTPKDYLRSINPEKAPQE